MNKEKEKQLDREDFVGKMVWEQWKVMNFKRMRVVLEVVMGEDGKGLCAIVKAKTVESYVESPINLPQEKNGMTG